MDEPPLSPMAMTVLGAAFAGLAAGSLAILAASVYGAAIGLAVAMPFLIQFGHGFGTFDRGAYFAARTRGGVTADAAAIAVAAAIAGSLAAAALGVVDLPVGVEAGVATAAAFAGGGAAFLWRTAAFHDGQGLAPSTAVEGEE